MSLCRASSRLKTSTARRTFGLSRYPASRLTIRVARDNGFWAGLTIYPVSKVTPQRGADILEQFGPQMICVNSASDWGESSPSMLTDTCLEYLRRGHTEREATEVFYNNPCRFFGQCPKWKRAPVE